jgi:carboxymethylenebutenolidase
MSEPTSDHKHMLSIWQRHTYAEFVLKDAEAALATMTANPYVLCIPSGTGGVGRADVRNFYTRHFLPQIPEDFELTPVSQTFGNNGLVEEFVVRFTHTIEMDWMLPGVRPRGRKVEVVLVGVIGFKSGRIAHEHLYWDQATVLSQLGVPSHPIAAAGCGSAAQLLSLTQPPLSSDALNA